ncbi:MAG TPA: VOC family protein [candidate division Zixibacteria bacterium]|nr:VOC family protein [candidate division Zixibacteria bacterium]
MIKSVHTMFYSSEAEKLRTFIKEKLGFSYTDVGGGWLIFNLPAAEMGCHPAENEKGAPSGTHSISFITSDVHKTMKKLQAKGVEFTSEVKDFGYGLVTRFKMPGDIEVDLYQPKYKLKKPKSKKRASAKKKTSKKKRK